MPAERVIADNTVRTYPLLPEKRVRLRAIASLNFTLAIAVLLVLIEIFVSHLP